jgi:DNA-binding XRE family transcriptional regulator
MIKFDDDSKKTLDNPKREKRFQKYLIKAKKMIEKEEEKELFLQFSDFLKNYRIQKKLTQEEISKLAGISQQQFSKIEKGKNINILTIGKIIKSLNLELAFVEKSNHNKIVGILSHV